MNNNERWEHIRSTLAYLQGLIAEDVNLSMVCSITRTEGGTMTGSTAVVGKNDNIGHLLYAWENDENPSAIQAKMALAKYRIARGEPVEGKLCLN